jgi:hypothetical protein
MFRAVSVARSDVLLLWWETQTVCTHIDDDFFKWREISCANVLTSK